MDLLENSAPKDFPGRVRYFMPPGGIPASTRASYNFRPVNGASLVGLKTTVLPAIKAPAIIVVASDNGKLNGEMTAQAPYGRTTLLLSSPGTMRSIGMT